MIKCRYHAYRICLISIAHRHTQYLFKNIYALKLLFLLKSLVNLFHHILLSLNRTGCICWLILNYFFKIWHCCKTNSSNITSIPLQKSCNIDYFRKDMLKVLSAIVSVSCFNLRIVQFKKIRNLNWAVMLISSPHMGWANTSRMILIGSENVFGYVLD